MPRPHRTTGGGICYHVLSRGNDRRAVFRKEGDYAAFLRLMGEANERLSMGVLAYCLMPNHFHLVLRPEADGDLSRWMQWLMTSHVRRYHRHYRGSGHVWQGRFKSFPIQEDEHLLAVVRYVELNPVRAKTLPTTRVDQWPWSSAGNPPGDTPKPPLMLSAIFPRPRSQLSRKLSANQLESIQRSITRGSPLGDLAWQEATAKTLGLESTLRPRGRPKKAKK